MVFEAVETTIEVSITNATTKRAEGIVMAWVEGAPAVAVYTWGSRTRGESLRWSFNPLGFVGSR